MITGFGTVREAVDAISKVRRDFITKPFQFEALLHELNGSALEQRRLRAENAYLRAQLHDQRYRIDGIIDAHSR